MPSRTRRLIAGTGIAAGLLVGSVAPAAALPGEPSDDHCARIERFEEVALARIGRFEDRIERFQRQIERIESRVEQGPARARPESRPPQAGPEGRPAQAGQLERRLERLTTRIERFENRIAAITARYDAIAAHCGADPLFPATDDPATDDAGSNTPIDGIAEPDTPAGA